MAADADPDADQVTQLLREAGAGDRAAASRLVPMLYTELRRLAESQMRALAPGGGQTLQPTALVHEAFMRLIGKEDPARLAPNTPGIPDAPDTPPYQNRFHFFFAASRAMHDILVESARAKAALKRGGAAAKVAFDPDALVTASDADPAALLALSDSLARLEHTDPRKHQMVMLRFFAGLTASEAAELMDTPLRTFERQWRFVRAWLRAELTGEGPIAQGDAHA